MSVQTVISRRDFLCTTSTAAALALVGCAVNPVTGNRQFMLLSERDEIDLDQSHAPHQLSGDYGVVQDVALNRYIQEVGMGLKPVTHRAHMPYSFQVVNAVYVNAYAFPGGTIAATRGMMLTLENEAELAALLGHELGHVNARHTADRMSKQMLMGAAVFLGGAIATEKDETAGLIVQGLGSIGSGLMLAHYSREDEHQADKLGMEYMVKAGYHPQGMLGLMDVLRDLSGHKPNVIEKLFASHPMSDERYAKAQARLKKKYAHVDNAKLLRERYMDNTASLRRQRKTIEALQAGETAMALKQFDKAGIQFNKALRLSPDDYAGLLMMAQCQLQLEKPGQAVGFVENARTQYPEEPQSRWIGGLAYLSGKQYARAFSAFDAYEAQLPGNPGVVFFKGYTQEGMQHRQEAAQEYLRFLGQVTEGEQAKHARQRLIEWGYLKQAPEGQYLP